MPWLSRGSRITAQGVSATKRTSINDHEILRSDSVRLADRANQRGAVVTLKVWDAMWHVWHYHADLPEAQQALAEIRDFLYQTLQIEAK